MRIQRLHAHLSPHKLAVCSSADCRRPLHRPDTTISLRDLGQAGQSCLRFNRHYCLLSKCLTVFAAVFAVLPLLDVVSVVPIFEVVCSFDWADSSASGRFYIYWAVVQGCVLIAILLAMNVFVIIEVRRMNSRVERVPLSKKEGETRRGRRGQEKYSEFTLLVIMVSVVFIVCTAPILVRTLFNQLDILPSKSADYAAKRLSIISSMINPHLYWTFRPKARKAIFKFFREKCNRLKRPGNDNDSPDDGEKTAEASLAATHADLSQNRNMMALKELLADPIKVKQIADELENPTKFTRCHKNQSRKMTLVAEVDYPGLCDIELEQDFLRKKEPPSRVSDVDLKVT
ncbi:PTGER4 [Branchiostoma lanceolatum]|uniref:PTGER4 protein n=1 Tax=Branchiostoma lanceolatum TaxID=7740 RepID=A0A8K0EHY9_BRALA|nr:PTGER4 [Branchiostoma lanceolatum]